jgi:hypothetical protein
MARTPPSRISRARVLDQLRQASRRGDRSSLTLAVEQMRVLANSPRYWQSYLALLSNPLARLVDLLVLKQGDRIAHQKGWKITRTVRTERKPAKPERPARRRAVRRDGPAGQASLFPDL